MKAVELPIKTLIDFSVEPTMNLVPSLTVMTVYYHWDRLISMAICRYFYKRQVHRSSSYLWCKVQSVQFSSWIIHICYLWLARPTILHIRSVTEIIFTSTTFVQLWHQSPLWPDWGCMMRFNPIALVLLLTTAFTEDEFFQAGKN